jgi:hypothetical protein
MSVFLIASLNWKGMAQVVEPSPSKLKALSSIPSTKKESELKNTMPKKDMH